MFLHQVSQKYAKFQWKQKLYQLLCLYSDLVSAPGVFTKLVKVPITILGRLNMLLIICLVNIILISRSQEESITARDTLIFFATNSELPDKFLEISTAALPEDWILGDGCGLQRYDTHSSTGENKFNNRSVSVVSLKRSIDSMENCSTDWETKLLSSSSSVPLLHYRSSKRLKILKFSMQKNFDRRVCLFQGAKKWFGGQTT